MPKARNCDSYICTSCSYFENDIQPNIKEDYNLEEVAQDPNGMV